MWILVCNYFVYCYFIVVVFRKYCIVRDFIVFFGMIEGVDYG